MSQSKRRSLATAAAVEKRKSAVTTSSTKKRSSDVDKTESPPVNKSKRKQLEQCDDSSEDNAIEMDRRFKKRKQMLDAESDASRNVDQQDEQDDNNDSDVVEEETNEDECEEEEEENEDKEEQDKESNNQDDDDDDDDDRMSDNDGESKFDQDEPVFAGSKKKHAPGVVYLSYIPEGLTVARTREILCAFGNIGRIYFEPVKQLNKKTRPKHRFTEGWVEFEKKKVAKRVAEVLNSTPVGGKRRAPYHDALWSIKYLHRFRWPHLSERLAYEKAVKDQRLRTEISQAKREASYYARALERSIRMKKQRQRMIGNTEGGGEGEPVAPPMAQGPRNVRLKKTDREHRQEKNQTGAAAVDKNLLMSIFSST